MAETSKTADQALLVLAEVIRRGPISAQDLSRALDLNRTACHRLLTTLHERGFIRKDASLYSVGHVFLRLAQEAVPTLLVRARPILRELASTHGETFLLSVVDGDDAVAIDQAIGDAHPIRVAYRLGERHPLVVGASGRSLLAHLPEQHAERAAAQSTDRATLAAQLEQVRRDGYCTSHDELNANVYGVSVPILEADTPLASLTVVAPVERADVITGLVPELRRAAERIREWLHG